MHRRRQGGSVLRFRTVFAVAIAAVIAVLLLGPRQIRGGGTRVVYPSPKTRYPSRGSPAMPLTGATTVHVVKQSPPVKQHPEHPPSGWRRISDIKELRSCKCPVALRAHNGAGRWVARVTDTRQASARFAEKLWKTREVSPNVFSFASVAGTRLGLNRETKLVAQQRYSGHEERWGVRFREKGSVELRGVGRDGKDKYVGAWGFGVAAAGQLVCNATETRHPYTTFAILTPTNCSSPDECWRPFLAEREALWSRSGGVNAADLGESVPLFGSPKPLNISHPRFEHNRLILDRVVALWKRFAPPLRPLLFVEPSDAESIKVGRARDIDLSTKFEHWDEYKQPTYRGLFGGAFKHAADQWHKVPDVAVYSNSDILYTPSLGQTLGLAVRHAREIIGPSKPLRLMLVGMRVNVEMPATFDPAADDTEEQMYRIAKTGNRYQTNAEDYFAVSRKLFDWGTLPPFIVGGVAFDNWFVGKANRAASKGERVVVVDSTDTVLALHQNHGETRKDSHRTPKSVFNRDLAMRHGSWARGRVVDAQYASLRMPWGQFVIVERRRLLFD